MFILVSESDQANAAPDAPAPIINTSTGLSFIYDIFEYFNIHENTYHVFELVQSVCLAPLDHQVAFRNH